MVIEVLWEKEVVFVVCFNVKILIVFFFKLLFIKFFVVVIIVVNMSEVVCECEWLFEGFVKWFDNLEWFCLWLMFFFCFNSYLSKLFVF